MEAKEIEKEFVNIKDQILRNGKLKAILQRINQLKTLKNNNKKKN